MADEAAAPTAPVVVPTETPAPLTPVAAVDPKAELEAMLKKMGGLEVMAGGKKHKVDSIEKLIRYAQRGLPVESSLEEISKQRAELEPVAALFHQLQNGTEEEQEAALEKLLDSGRLDKVAEKRLRRAYEREKSMEGLTPRERELQAELDAERGNRSKLEKEREEVAKKEAAAVEAQQVTSIKTHISGAIVKSLELLNFKVAGDPNAPDDPNARKLEPIAVEFMKPIIRATLNAGRPLDPEVLAEKVRPMLDQLFEYQTRGLEGDALLKRFGGDVGKRYRAALRAQLEGGGAKPAPKVPEKQEEPKSIWDPRKMF